MPSPRYILFPLILAAMIAPGEKSSPAMAAESALISVERVEIGFGGKYKSGYWTPVWLTLRAGPQAVRGDLTLEATDGDNVPVIFAAEPPAEINLAAGGTAAILRYVKFGPIRAPLAVLLKRDDKTIFRQELNRLVPAALLSTRELVVTLGPLAGIEEAISGVKRAEELAYAGGRVEDVARLPDRWWGYEGVRWLLVTTGKDDFYRQLSGEQFAALREWVLLGGHLILSCGERGEDVLAAGSPWREFVPVEGVSVAPLRQTIGLESFGGATFAFGDDDAARPQMTVLANPAGRVLLDETGATGGRPLVVQSPVGLGQVTFIALDLNHSAIANWSGRGRLIANILQASQTHRDEQRSEKRRSVTHLGYDDLVGQLRAALDQFPGVTVVNFTTVSVLTILYLLILGPGDYLLLEWLKIPRAVTWVTFPLVAIAFCGIAWYLGGIAHGARLRINQVEVIDVDAERAIVRGTVWLHLYSPASARHDVSLGIDAPLLSATEPPIGHLTWQGLPGTALGGLASEQVSLSTVEPYTVLPASATPSIANLPIQVASSKSLSGRWWGEVELASAPQLGLNEFGLLNGSFTNPFPVELHECVLAHHESLYRLGTVKGGAAVELADFSPLNLEWRLTERTVIDSKDRSQQWQPASTDVPRILQMLMFHDVARGFSYTGLTHHYQPYIDFSEQIRSGRAVLAGYAHERVTTASLDGQSLADSYDASQSWTVFRLVLPVRSVAVETEK
jgi:hypothetical protein